MRLVHATFIRQVVALTQRPEGQAELEGLLAEAEQQGWSGLVAVLRRIAKGERSPALLSGLDEEDQVIVESVLRGLQDPSSLPDPSQAHDPTLAAPGLAHMIHAARTDPQALVLIGNMADQMSKVGGSMARLAGVVRPLINGERNADQLCRGMDTQTRQLVLEILGELGKLEAH
ncbi:hypothetical protein LT988_18290 [Thiocapsa bogorovii]|nr:hypothetical protein [Thiocapsa bogorovii]UHD18967.1 hypothetical protein LT988_18290 [Thiocapsa bogorovii]